MAHKGIYILLILMMVVAPITSAFDRCSLMVMPETVVDQAVDVDDHATMNRQIKPVNHLDNHDQNNCHSQHDCTFHVCSAYGLLLSDIPIHNPLPLMQPSGLVPHLPHSTTLSPALRPPIVIL